MRSMILLASLLSCASFVACGAKPAKDASTSPPPSASTVAASASVPAPAPDPPKPVAAPDVPPSPPDELSPPKDPDDPWLSHRQIAPDVVVKTVKPAAAKIDKCFKDGLKRDPTIEGEVRLRFVITHEGKVLDFKDDSSEMPDHEVVACIGNVIKTLKFPVQEAPGGAFGVYSTHLSK